jgi:hypothetical protein
MAGQSWTVHNIGRRVIFGDRPNGVYIWPMNPANPDGWGEPFIDDEGDPINPPLGTSGGTNPIIRLKKIGGSLDVLRGQAIPLAGNVDWTNGTDTISFDGPPSRSAPPMAGYFYDDTQAILSGYQELIGFAGIPVNWGNFVYKDGEIIADTDELKILGAALASVTSSTDEVITILIVVVMIDNFKDEVLYAEWDGETVITVFESAGEIVYPRYTGLDESGDCFPIERDHPFHFSSTGLKAATVYKEDIAHNKLGPTIKNSMLEIELSYSLDALSFTTDYAHYLPHIMFETGSGESYQAAPGDPVINRTTSIVSSFQSPRVVLAADYKNNEIKKLEFVFTSVNSSYSIDGTSPIAETKAGDYEFDIVLNDAVVDTVTGFFNNSFLKPGTNTFRDSEVFINYCDIRNSKLIWTKREVNKSSVATAEEASEGSVSYTFTANISYTINSKITVYDSGTTDVLHNVTTGPHTSAAPTIQFINYLTFPEDPAPGTVTTTTIDAAQTFYNHLRQGGGGFYNEGFSALLTDRVTTGYSQTLYGTLIANVHYQFNEFWFDSTMQPTEANPSLQTSWANIPPISPANYVYISGTDESDLLSVSGANWGIAGQGYEFKILKV